jgi:hypothetical protein
MGLWALAGLRIIKVESIPAFVEPFLLRNFRIIQNIQGNKVIHEFFSRHEESFVKFMPINQNL